MAVAETGVSSKVEELQAVQSEKKCCSCGVCRGRDVDGAQEGSSRSLARILRIVWRRQRLSMLRPRRVQHTQVKHQKTIRKNHWMFTKSHTKATISAICRLCLRCLHIYQLPPRPAGVESMYTLILTADSCRDLLTFEVSSSDKLQTRLCN